MDPRLSKTWTIWTMSDIKGQDQRIVTLHNFISRDNIRFKVGETTPIRILLIPKLESLVVKHSMLTFRWIQLKKEVRKTFHKERTQWETWLMVTLKERRMSSLSWKRLIPNKFLTTKLAWTDNSKNCNKEPTLFSEHQKLNFEICKWISK